MARVPDPQITFADLEFMRQGVRLDPLLQSISDFIDDQPALIERVRQDLERGLRFPGTGRNGLTARHVLRSLTLQRVKNWDYRELRERIADGFTLRRFTGFMSRSVPKHDAFHRAFNRLTPKTLEAINNAVVQAAVGMGLEKGNKLRVDTTVVETDIHHPTDSMLLWDTVRVVCRLVKQLGDHLPRGIAGFTNRTRSARRRMQEIQRMTPQQRVARQLSRYRQLIGTTEEVIVDARRVLEKTKKVQGAAILSDLAIEALHKEIEHYCALGDQVISQASRRVFGGEQVAAHEKLYSIFEPHTDLIKRGKVAKPVEFGHKVFLAESACGLITQYRVLDGNPTDEHLIEPSLKHHKRTFGQAPALLSTDRGFYSEKNLEACDRAGVLIASIPQRGGKKTPEREAREKSPGFKKAQRFRAGIEGRISVLFRGRGMKRCLAKGRTRFELFVGAAVLANNLMVIANLLIKRQKRRRAA